MLLCNNKLDMRQEMMGKLQAHPQDSQNIQITMLVTPKGN